MMRDPLFYMFYKRIASVYYQFFYYIKPYTHEELLFPGVTIKNVKVSELVTYFDLVDFDVTNLLNDKMTFVDGEFVWDKTLLARQMRLNHKPFDFTFTIESDKAQKVVIRTFLGPKYDEFGRVISLTENRQNFMELDAFIYTLKAGVNEFKRLSKDFFWTTEDRTTYTELVQICHVLAFEGKYEFPLDISEPHCGFPDRLILPRGWAKGMPMQLFFYVTPSPLPTNLCPPSTTLTLAALALAFVTSMTCHSVTPSTVKSMNTNSSYPTCTLKMLKFTTETPLKSITTRDTKIL
ncbi:Arylphorin subunit C223, partial [Eumeta japonica]